MAAKKRKKRQSAPPTSEPPKIHEAELASGPSGAVLKGAEIDQAAAVARRQTGLDVVVCGNNLRANRNLAREIEAIVGPPTRPQEPHALAGPFALPHFHQQSRSPAGHAFYETASPRKKARKTS